MRGASFRTESERVMQRFSEVRNAETDRHGVIGGTGGFDPASTGNTWEISDDQCSVRHVGEPGEPTTALGATGHTSGDRQVTFTITEAPVGSYAQVGVCTAEHQPHERLGWVRSLGLGPDGVVRCRGVAGAFLGQLIRGDRITLRLRRGMAYLRIEPHGAWNGDPAADPFRGLGGIPLDIDNEIFPAVYSDTPGFEAEADFRGWTQSVAGFEPSPTLTSLAWEVAADRLSATHECTQNTPATLLGSSGSGHGDHEAILSLASLPAGAATQLGFCNPRHGRDNALGWRDSLGLGCDGLVRQNGRPTGHSLGAIRQRDAVTLRLSGGRAYFRVGDNGLWNGDVLANPRTRSGGIALGFDGPVHVAVYSEAPGTHVVGDFSRWAHGAQDAPEISDYFGLAATLARTAWPSSARGRRAHGDAL